MTKAIVDNLEAVRVEKQHGKYTIGPALGPFNRHPEVIHEKRSVRKTRQPVVKGLMNQPLFGQFSVRDVLNLKDQLASVGRGVVDSCDAQEHPDYVAILVKETLLALKSVSVAVQQLFCLIDQAAKVVRRADCLNRGPQELLFGIADHFEKRAVNSDPLAI